MLDIFSRFKAKLKEIFYEVPLPNFIKKLEPQKPLVDEKVPDEYDDLPDNFRDIKLPKYNKVYHLKLKDLAPHQWMQVGTTLRNMAYEDPDYGHDYDEDYLPGEPLPPPPPPTEYQKALPGPKISLNLKDLSWVELEEVGETLYDLGLHSRKDYDPDDYDSLPQEFERCDDELPESDAEDFEEEMFDPDTRIHEEMTEIKRITNSDVIPGIEKVPWKDDAELWLENPHPDTPPWEETTEDFIPQGKTFPLQSFTTPQPFFK